MWRWIATGTCLLVSIQPCVGGNAQNGEKPPPALSLSEGSESAVKPGLALSSGFGVPARGASQADQMRKAFELTNELRYEEAAKVFGEMLAKNPHDKQALLGKSVIHTKRYEYEQALAILEILMEQYPDDSAIKNNAAWIYSTADTSEIRNGERAVKLAREALVAAPGSYHIWSTMSEAYYVVGEFEKALNAAEEAYRMALSVKASPDNLRVYRDQILKNRKAVGALSLME